MEHASDSPPPSPGIDAWTRYWHAGPLHSCGCAFGSNYSGATETFWREQFADLRDGATLVDIGTGNGAIPLLARAAAQEAGRHWRLHGVDRARIDPAGTVAQPGLSFDGIVFHPGVSATDLPFADGSVDLVTSQFALEYMPREAAIAELARVLGLKGRAALVLHARDSVVLATTADQLAHFQLLFEDSALFSHARVMAQVMASARTPEQRRALAEDPRAQSLRHELNEAAGQVMDRAEQSRTSDLLRAAIGAVSSTLQAAASIGEEAALQRLSLHEQALRDEWDRLCDLDEAALTQPQVEAIRDGFVAHGYRACSIDKLRHAEDRDLGWTLVIA